MRFFNLPDEEVKELLAIPDIFPFPFKLAIEVNKKYYFIIDSKDGKDMRKLLHDWYYKLIHTPVPYKPLTKLIALDGMLQNFHFTIYTEYNVWADMKIISSKQARKEFKIIQTEKGEYPYKLSRIETFETYKSAFLNELETGENNLKEMGTVDKTVLLNYKIDFIEKKIQANIDNMSYGLFSTHGDLSIPDDIDMIKAHDTYCDWLKLTKNKIAKEYNLLLDNTPINSTTQSNNKRYSVGDYALFHIYLSLSDEGERVTNANKDEFASKYNIHSRRLYETYNKYNKPNARTETISSRSDTEKKKRFEKVIELLQQYPNALKRAIDEQKTFIANSQRTYE